MRSESRFWLTPLGFVAAAALPSSAQAAGLNLYPDWITVATNVGLFLLLIYPVNRLLVRPLLAVHDERESRTAGALAQSQRLADETRAARVALEARLAEARANAQARRNAILAAGESDERRVLDAAREEGNGIVESVRQAVLADLAEARGGLRTEARALAREAAGSILGRAL